MNIWNYAYKKVRIVDKDGDVFIGNIIDVSDGDEMGDVCVSLENKQGHITGLYESEIKSIELI